MKLPKLGRIGTIIVLFVPLSAAGTAVAFQATSSSSPAASKTSEPRAAATVRSAAASSKPRATSAAAKTTNEECVNSFDPKCGRFYWDPAPGSNADLLVTVSPETASVAVGEPVSFSATATDPDAKIVCDYVYWGEGVNVGTAVRMRSRNGRWIPPAKEQSRETKTFSHTYTKAGTYTIIVTFVSGDDCAENYNPYGSDGGATLTVTVR